MSDKPKMGDQSKKIAFLIVAFLLLIFVGIYLCNFAGLLKGNGSNDDYLTLGAIVLVGLALVVVLMAVLAIFYKVLGVEDKGRALALPVGSVRALIAFSLVLIFVCLGAFLYHGVNTVEIPPEGKTLTKIDQAALDELKKNFIVAAEPYKEPGGTNTPPPSAGGGSNPPGPTGSNNPAGDPDANKKTQYFNVTYFSKRSKEADDFAKQMFTTLATVFVSVVSFYFGSSTTSSGVDAGVKAAGGGSSSTPAGAGDPAFLLNETKASAHDVQLAAAQAQSVLDSLNALKGKPPFEGGDRGSKLEAAIQDVQKALNAINQATKQVDEQVANATKAASDFVSAATDAAKKDAQTAAASARDTAKGLASTAKSNADKATAALKGVQGSAS